MVTSRMAMDDRRLDGATWLRKWKRQRMPRFKGYLWLKPGVTKQHLLHRIHLLPATQIHLPITSRTNIERHETKAWEMKRHNLFRSAHITLIWRHDTADQTKSFSAILYPQGLGGLCTIRSTGNSWPTESSPRSGPVTKLVALNNHFILSTCVTCRSVSETEILQVSMNHS